MRRYTNVIFTKNNAWIILYILGMNDKIKTIKLCFFLRKLFHICLYVGALF